MSVSLFNVVLTFDVGDPETVARLTIPEVPAASHDEAVLAALTAVDFDESDLIEATVTRARPGVARNLLARHT